MELQKEDLEDDDDVEDIDEEVSEFHQNLMATPQKSSTLKERPSLVSMGQDEE